MEKTITTHTGIIYKWIDPHYKEKIKQGSKKRTIESDCIKDKLEQLHPGTILSYKNTGQPIIQSNSYSHISISHSKNIFSIYLSNEPVGIDVQHFKETLVKGMKYFVNSEEYQLELTPFHLLLIWSAKEAFYKKKGGAIADVVKEVTVKRINEDKQCINVEYNHKTETLHFQVQNNVALVWT